MTNKPKKPPYIKVYLNAIRDQRLMQFLASKADGERSGVARQLMKLGLKHLPAARINEDE